MQSHVRVVEAIPRVQRRGFNTVEVPPEDVLKATCGLIEYGPFPHVGLPCPGDPSRLSPSRRPCVMVAQVRAVVGEVVEIIAT